MADKEDKLNSSLECHVCFESYKINQHIWQCTSGHSVCNPCRRKLHECPFCKAPYEGTRNYAIEEIIMELSGSDSVKAEGDNNLLPKPSAPYEEPEVDNVVRINENLHMPLPSPSNDGEMVMVDIPRPTARQNLNNVWLRCDSNNVRQFEEIAIVGGQDHGRIPLYIGRAEWGGALIPGKVNFENRRCYVPWGGEEHEKSSFEILHSISGTWLPNSGGTVPMNAFAAGRSEQGEKLYIGRAWAGGTLCIGKVQPSHGCCYISYDGGEHPRQIYEIFVLDP